MKKKCMRMVALIFAAVLMLTGTLAVSAAELLCSLTVHLTDLGTTLGGVEIAVYQVGELKSQDNLQVFLPIKGLEDMETVFTADNLNQAAVARETAVTLADRVEALAVEGIHSTTDTDGTAVFEKLTPGIYLVKQNSGESTYGTIQPFLAVLPSLNFETGELLSQVDASPKAEKPDVTPTVPEEPGTEKDPDTSGETDAGVQPKTENPEKETPESIAVPEGSSEDGSPGTGDETPLLAWGIVLAASAAAIAGVMLKRKSKNES